MEGPTPLLWLVPIVCGLLAQSLTSFFTGGCCIDVVFLDTVHRRFSVVFHVFLQISVDVVRDQLHGLQVHSFACFLTVTVTQCLLGCESLATSRPLGGRASVPRIFSVFIVPQLVSVFNLLFLQK